MAKLQPKLFYKRVCVRMSANREQLEAAEEDLQITKRTLTAPSPGRTRTARPRPTTQMAPRRQPTRMARQRPSTLMETFLAQTKMATRPPRAKVTLRTRPTLSQESATTSHTTASMATPTGLGSARTLTTSLLPTLRALAP